MPKIEIKFEKLSKPERDKLVRQCICGLESKDPRLFYQATVAAKLIGRDERLHVPLMKVFKKSRGWRHQLVLDVVPNNTEPKIYPRVRKLLNEKT